MDGIRLNPDRGAVTASVVGLVLVSIVSLAVPQLGVVWAVLTPLAACPLIHHKEEPFCWAAMCLPAVSSLIRSQSVMQALCSLVLLLPGGLPMLFTRFVPLKKRIGPKGLISYLGLVTLGLTAAMAVIGLELGGPMALVIAQRLTDAVVRMDDPGRMLYQLARAGLLNVPETAGLRSFLQPAVIREMLLSLRLTLELLLQPLLPSLFVQACLMVGLFTALRVERMNGVILMVETNPQKPSERRTHVLAPPGFGLLAASKGLLLALSLMGLAAAVLVSLEGSYYATLAQLMYQTFYTGYALLGAAVFCGLMCSKDPQHRTQVGAAAAAIYLLAPFALFLLGVTDQFVNYRTRSARRTDS